MKRKPQTFGDLIRTVLAVETIGLFSVRYFARHKLALVTIASRGDISGVGRPLLGEILTQALEVKDWRTTKGYLEDLVKADLLLPGRKVKAPGRSNGFMYCWDLNLQHPAYPDSYPDSPCKNLPENASSETDSTCKVEGLNLQPAEVEPAKSGNSTCKNLRENASYCTSTALPLQDQPTTNPGWWETFAGTLGHAGEEIQPKLEAIGNELGLLLAKATLKAFIKRPQTLNGLNHPWKVFVKEYQTHIAAGRETQYDGMSLKERMAADPELKASIEAQEAERREQNDLILSRAKERNAEGAEELAWLLGTDTEESDRAEGR